MVDVQYISLQEFRRGGGKMKIHLVSAVEKPSVGCKVMADCGAEVEFTKPITVSYSDGRLCEGCREAQKTVSARAYLFAIKEEDSTRKEEG